jgi:hypothetical protein
VFQHICIIKQILVTEIKAEIQWQTFKRVENEMPHLPTEDDMLALSQRSWNNGMRSIIQSMSSILQQLPIWIPDFVSIIATTEIPISKVGVFLARIFFHLSKASEGATQSTSHILS